MKNHFIVKNNVNVQKYQKNHENIFYNKDSIKNSIMSLIENINITKNNDSCMLEKNKYATNDERHRDLKENGKENKVNKLKSKDNFINNNFINLMPYRKKRKIYNSKNSKFFKNINLLEKKTYDKNINSSINSYSHKKNKNNNTQQTQRLFSNAEYLEYLSKNKFKNIRLSEYEANHVTVNKCNLTNTNHAKDSSNVNNLNNTNNNVNKTKCFYSTIKLFNKSKTNIRFSNDSGSKYDNLYITDISSVKRNTVFKNTIFERKEKSVSKSKYNKTVLPEQKINKFNSDNKRINKIKGPLNNNHRMIFNIKEFYKKFKKNNNNNELIKEKNGINETTDKNLISERVRKNKKTNIRTNSYSFRNRSKYNSKLTFTLRNRCNIKKRYNLNMTKKNKFILIDEKEVENETNIRERDTKNEKEKEKEEEMEKLIILIKSNWGNLYKINFTNINFIDQFNEIINIYKANYDNNKQYEDSYIKGETKQLIFYYNKKRKIKNIEIVNGFDDSGIKSIVIENGDGQIIWRGNIPKITMISNKPYTIILNKVKAINNNKKKEERKNNHSFDMDTSLLFNNNNNIFNPTTNNIKKQMPNINRNKRNNKNNIKTFLYPSKIRSKNHIKSINETFMQKLKRFNESYDRDSVEMNIINHINITNTNSVDNDNSKNKRIKSKSKSKSKNKKINNVNYQICDKIKIQII